MKHLNKFNLHFLILSCAFFSIFTACKKENNDFSPSQDSKYTNGFYIIGEGSYGRNAGAVHFYTYGEDTIQYRAYEKENPGKILSNDAMTSTLQFANLIDGSLYLLCKVNGPIVKVNAASLKEEARYTQESSNWRNIIKVSGERGLVSAADGVYQINLNTLNVEGKLNTIVSVNSSDMLLYNKHVFIQQANGVKIISTDNNYSFIKSFRDLSRGFAQTPNGKIWSSNGKSLVSIDENLDTAQVALLANIASFGLDAPTRLTASTKENAVFYTSKNDIYKYIDGDSTSLLKPFISITKTPFMVYGVARYDRNKDYIVVNGIQGYGAASTVNYLLIYNASTGALVKEIQYGGDGIEADFSKISFPALTIFQ